MAQPKIKSKKTYVFLPRRKHTSAIGLLLTLSHYECYECSESLPLIVLIPSFHVLWNQSASYQKMSGIGRERAPQKTHTPRTNHNKSLRVL